MRNKDGRPRWATRVLAGVHRLVALRRVRFTLKAIDELEELELALDEEDAIRVIADLKLGDLVEPD